MDPKLDGVDEEKPKKPLKTTSAGIYHLIIH